MSDAKISSRPTTIAIAQTHFAESETSRKVIVTSARPGPTLLSEAATADQAVTWSISNIMSRSISTANTIRYIAK